MILNMEHDDFSSDISSEDFDDHHEHELTIKQQQIEMLAFEFLKMVHTIPHSNFAKNQINIRKIFKTFS